VSGSGNDRKETPASALNYCGPAAPVVVAALAGLVGAWIAAGAAGVLGHPLRRGLACAALSAAVVAAWPKVGTRAVRLAVLAAGAAVAVAMIASMLPPVNVLAAAVVLAALGHGHSGANRRTLLLAAEAVVLLALYRLAYTSIPWVWHLADSLGGVLGSIAGVFTWRPLTVGATFAGLDVLLTMTYLAIMAPLRSDRSAALRSDRPASENRQWLWQIPVALLAVVVGQGVYLIVLSLAEGFPATLPKVDVPLGNQQSVQSMLDFLSMAALQSKIFPWHLPAAAIAIQVPIGWILCRWLVRSAPVCSDKGNAKAEAAGSPSRLWLGWGATAAAILLAVCLPMLTTLRTQSPSLVGKKIVMYEKGYLNWLKPKHGDYGRFSVGMYGMLPIYLESLGATAVISPDLSAEDLRGADALVLILPDQPWKRSQLKRIRQFVRRGGKLLVMGEHTVREEDGDNRFNEVLEPTGMRVPFDTAMYAVGGWLHSYQPLAHPTSAGIPDESNDFGVVAGGSVDASWNADPLLVGRWGWTDLGDDVNGPAKLGDYRYTSGEKLGDVVLAAERPLGKGSVIVFGDTSGLTNLLTVGCHQYTSRLFAYLGDDAIGPHAVWRRYAALCMIVVLAIILIWRPTLHCPAAVAVAMALSLVVCTTITNRVWEVLPDGGHKEPNNLAYIDTSHAEAFSHESWRPDGIIALSMTLMRSGYLTLTLPEMTPERLRRAKLLGSIAPNREFSKKERETLDDFVDAGGIFICTVGYRDAGPSRAMLSDFGFHVGWAPADLDRPGAEPIPLGHFKSAYPDDPRAMQAVRFHAGWPVACDRSNTLVVSRRPPDLPLIIVRRYGKGLIAVIGDTGFAMNENLERIDGAPIEGAYENAEFWRWFLTLLGAGEAQSAAAPVNDGSAAPVNDGSAGHDEPDASREETP